MLAACSCALLGLSAAPASAASSWLAPVGIASQATAFIDEPEVAVGPDGSAVALWVRFTPPETYVVEAATKGPGPAWSAPVAISPPGVAAFTPRVATDTAGNAVAVWRGAKGMSQQVTQAATKPRDGSWTPAVDISPPGVGSYSPDVAVGPTGSAIAVWRASAGTEELIQAAAWSPGGAWTPAEDLSPAGKESNSPDVDIDSEGNAVAAWYSDDIASDAVIEAARRPGGGAWGDSEELSEEGENSYDPQVAAGPGGAVVIWERDSVIQASIGKPGPPWQPKPTDLSEPSVESNNSPMVAADHAGNAVAVWTSNVKSGERLVTAATRAPGAPFTPPRSLSAAGLESFSPRPAVGPAGHAFVLWRSNLPGFVGVQAAVGNTAGAWSPATTISTPGRNIEYANVAADERGDALAVWRAAGPQVVEAAAYDATGPELRSMTVPKRGRAGKSLSFAVAPFDAWSALGPVSWDFGDKATPATGSSVKHSFPKHGKFKVTASVTDAIGNTASATATVDVSRALATSKKAVQVKKGRALLKLSCPGKAACTGQAKLTVPGKGKRKPKRATTLGKAKFKVRPGKKKTVPIKLNGKALELLRGKSKLRAKLSGNAVQERTVVLKPAAAGRKPR